VKEDRPHADDGRRIGLTFFLRIGGRGREGRAVGAEEHETFRPDRRGARCARAAAALREQVIVDQGTLSGLAVDLARYKGGANFDDLLGEKKPEKPAPRRKRRPTAARDRHRRHLAPQREHRLAGVGRGTGDAASNVNLKTGRIASGVLEAELAAKIEEPTAAAALQVNLDTGYRLNFRPGCGAVVARPQGEATRELRLRRRGSRATPSTTTRRPAASILRASTSPPSRRTGSTRRSRSRSSSSRRTARRARRSLGR
jgi:hypothetical protein